MLGHIYPGWNPWRAAAEELELLRERWHHLAGDDADRQTFPGASGWGL